MRPCGSERGVLYGLCKVHKKPDEPNRLLPLRPILSAIGTCSYNLAKFFLPLLKEFSINEYTVKDSFSFSNEIRNKSTMASFDIQSLFTNISLDETIDICLELLFNKKRKVKGMLKKHVIEILTHAVKSSKFTFNDVYYKQVDRLAMGSPFGPTLANLFLVYYESKWLENCSQQFKPQFYHRYVDDVFVMFKKRDHVKKFLRYINSRHRDIKFTCEEEKDNKISFLDISIRRNNNAMETSIFRKPIYSGVYTNFNSFLPTEYKRFTAHVVLQNI